MPELSQKRRVQLEEAGYQFVKIAIVGSRNFKNKAFIATEVSRILLEHQYFSTAVVSGGAPGVDTVAHALALDWGVEPIIFEANWQKYGRSAGPSRNKKIVKAADVMIAFPFPGSRGTRNSIKLMREAGKPVHVIELEQS